MILWLAGPAMALLGLLIAWAFVRQRPTATAPDSLSAEESARLDRIMRDDEM